MIENLGYISICIVIYFLPTIIGTIRQVDHIEMIKHVNTYSGWTVVGWFVCLVSVLVDKNHA